MCHTYKNNTQQTKHKINKPQSTFLLTNRLYIHMALDDLKPPNWQAINQANREQIDTLLRDVEAKTHGSLTPGQRSGVSLVVGLMGENRVQYTGPEGRGRQLLLASFNTKTGTVLPELSEDAKDRIRDVAKLLETTSERVDPKSRKFVRV